MGDRYRILLIADAAAGPDRQLLKGVGRYANAATGWLFRSYGPINEDELCQRLIDTWRPTGILSTSRTWSPPLQRAHALGTPIVQAHEIDGDDAALPVARIRTDGRATAELAVEHFVGRGLRSVGYVGAPRGLPARNAERMRVAAAARGVEFACFLGEPRGEWDADRRLPAWLAGRPRRTGLLASSDWYAWHATTECVDAGFAVPDDFAVLGVGDDSPYCELAPVPLSSVAVAAERIGYRAASLLEQLMRGDPVPADPIEVPPVGIVTRRSTETIAAEDPDVAAALRYIHDHAASGCTVKEVLQAVAIDRRRLERWCRQQLGRSPLDEIQRLRVDHVKRLLVETDERLEEVARRAGFGSATVLCRAFQRETGTTVARYRRQFQRARADPATARPR